jgi:hypothetical protein
MFIAALILAQAATAAPATPPAATPGQKPTAKIECRAVMETGSRIPTKVCRLDKEWDLLAKDAQDDMRTSRNKSFGTNPDPR